MLLVEGHRLGADHLLAGPFVEGGIARHVSDSVWVAAVGLVRVWFNIRVVGILVAASLDVALQAGLVRRGWLVSLGVITGDIAWVLGSHLLIILDIDC